MSTAAFSIATNRPTSPPSQTSRPPILSRTPSAFAAFPQPSAAKCSFPENKALIRPSAPTQTSSSDSLLARRRSSKGAMDSARPTLSLIQDLKLPELPAPDAIREHIIGKSAISDSESPTRSEAGSPRSLTQEMMDKTFKPTSRRFPTPFPESRDVFIDDDEDDDEEDGEDVGDKKEVIRVEARQTEISS